MSTTIRSHSRAARLLGGASLATVLLVAAGAHAQPRAAAAAPAEVEEVIVTGSSIRGAAPVGSNLIAVGQADIEKTGAQTIQQVLRSVPSVVGMGAVGQGGFGSADGAGTNAPTIHGLGASASNSTLILIDGHRFPLSGINHTLADPNILAPLALERVEVLADGASSVYGSDAVAGVINFITRRRFDGVQVRAQTGYADGYHTYAAGIVGGKTWDTGSVLGAIGYSDRDGLLTAKRDITKRDRRAIGGSNLASFFCSPASIQVGSGNIIPAPYTGAGVANAAANSFCDYSGVADLIPSEKRWTGMAKVTQEIGDNLTLSGDMVYSDRNNLTRDSRGTVQATIFGPGNAAAVTSGQVNPFFQAPAGSTATSESIRFDANELFGPGAKTESGEETAYFHGSGEYKLGENWRATLGGTYGFNNSFTYQTGGINASATLLALNGTTNGGGSLTTPSINGTNIVITQRLDANNALDVFNTGSANRTSAATRARILDSAVTNKARQTLKNATFKVDGDLFEGPAGAIKAAFGAEYVKYSLIQDVIRPNGTGPASTGSSSLHLEYDRDVKSAYAEFLIPLVSPEMGVPLVRSFDVNVSGRYDKYSDFGSTKNPRVAANWGVVEGLKFRGNWAKSFVAPALTSRGADALGTTGETSIAGGPTLSVPVSAYPTMVGGIPGCVTGAVTCSVGGGVTGLQVNGGNADLNPQKGESWSVGADWDVAFAPGLRLSGTYWSNKIIGGITAPAAALAVNAAGLNSLLTIYPGGATAAQIAAITAGRPLNTSIPAQVYYVYNFQQRNALNLWVEGIDMSANYGFDTGAGRIGLEAIGSYKTKFTQQVGVGGAKFDVLGTTGFNTTFPSIKFESRVGVTWDSDFGLSANVFWNHTGKYRNWSGTTVEPLVRNAAGVPTGGGDKVKAGNFFDAHVAYDFPGEGMTKDLQLFADVNNVFDKNPPFYNSNNGYDTFSGNPLGRQITVGFSKKW
jgi:iron complex outermembrane receptor protein